MVTVPPHEVMRKGGRERGREGGGEGGREGGKEGGVRSFVYRIFTYHPSLHSLPSLPPLITPLPQVLLFPDADGEASLVSLRAQSTAGVMPAALNPQVGREGWREGELKGQ